ncbi:MAG: DUF1461 domain-containing protein [Eubacteriales bacterium]|nr:DUF1461 domain-containing protein [Eubacteriales bacterium]
MSQPSLRRFTAVLSFLAGLALTVLLLAASLYGVITRSQLFEQAVLQRVDLSALTISEADARAFAAETIFYLKDEEPLWQPAVQMGGEAMPIPAAFTIHMAEVKAGVSLIGYAIPAAVFLMLAIAVWSLLSGNQGTGFSLRNGLIGMAVPLGVIALLLLWACLDFRSLWAWLHTSFIPGGIFAADEPIMQLFPLALFNDYIAPFSLTFGLWLAADILLLFAAKAGRSLLFTKKKGR